MRVRVRVRALRLLELLEELVVLAGALLLLLHVLLHAPALRRADGARVLVVTEARLVGGVRSEIRVRVRARVRVRVTLTLSLTLTPTQPQP